MRNVITPGAAEGVSVECGHRRKRPLHTGFDGMVFASDFNSPGMGRVMQFWESDGGMGYDPTGYAFA